MSLLHFIIIQKTLIYQTVISHELVILVFALILEKVEIGDTQLVISSV